MKARLRRKKIIWWWDMWSNRRPRLNPYLRKRARLFKTRRRDLSRGVDPYRAFPSRRK